MTEVFACGTAAVVCGIKELRLRIGHAPGDWRWHGGRSHAASLNAELQGIQFGRMADRHHWMEVVG